jgi:hypothetical protein
MRGTDSEEMMLAVGELGTEVTAEDIWDEGNYLCCFFFYWDLVQGFYTMVWVPYETVLFAYLQREWEDGHKKKKKKEKKREWGE